MFVSFCIETYNDKGPFYGVMRVDMRKIPKTSGRDLRDPYVITNIIHQIKTSPDVEQILSETPYQKISYRIIRDLKPGESMVTFDYNE